MHELTTDEWAGDPARPRSPATCSGCRSTRSRTSSTPAAGRSSTSRRAASVFGVPGISVYSAGKGGMNALDPHDGGRVRRSRACACNTIIVGRVVAYAAGPGPGDDEGAHRRVGKPSDIGYAALWLAADESEWITGSEVTADGGAGHRPVATSEISWRAGRSPSRSGPRRTRGTAPPSPRRCARSSTPSARRGSTAPARRRTARRPPRTATERLATTTNTASATTASSVSRPSCPRPAAAPTASTRFFGFTTLSSSASPKARTGVIVSTVAIHLGSVGRLARLRALGEVPPGEPEQEHAEDDLAPGDGVGGRGVRARVGGVAHQVHHACSPPRGRSPTRRGRRGRSPGPGRRTGSG